MTLEFELQRSPFGGAWFYAANEDANEWAADALGEPAAWIEPTQAMGWVIEPADLDDLLDAIACLDNAHIRIVGNA